MAQMPAPPLSSVAEQKMSDMDLCERDYSVKCPDKFVNVGRIFGSETEYCAATAEYDGPCASEAHSFKGMSIKAKARWSKLCQTSWPCVLCERNYEAICPQGWTRLNATLSCAPPSSYAGPCRGDDAFEYTLARDATSPSFLKMISTDFSGYNAAMMDVWSAECGAYWPCA